MTVAPEGRRPLAALRGAVRRERAAALVLAAGLCFVGLTNHGLWIPDEPRVAEVGRAMLESGDLVVPRLGGRPFLETPPTTWWTMLPTLRLFGANATGARLPVGLACLGVVLLARDLARMLAGRRAAAAVGLVAMTIGGVAWHGHRCVADPWLMLTVTFALWCLVRALGLRRGRSITPAPGSAGEGGGEGSIAAGDPPRPGWVVLAYVAAGLCFHAKGVVGVALAGAPGLALVIASGRLRGFARSWAHLVGLLLFAAIVLPWPLALHARDARLRDKLIADSLTKRVTDAADGGGNEHHVGPWFYGVQAPLQLLPWTLALPAAWCWLRRRGRDAGRAGLLGLLAACGGGVLLLSIPAAKRAIYILPLLPALAPLLGAWLVRSGRSDRPLDRATQLGLLVLVPLLPLAALVAALLAAAGVSPGGDHDLEVGPVLLLGLAATSGLCGALAAAAWRAWRARSARTGGLILWGLAVAVLAAQALLYPALDASRGPGDVVDFLRRACAPAPTFGYVVDEATIALAPLEAHVALESSWEQDDLRAFVAAHPGGRVLVFEHMDGLVPPDVRPRLLLIERWVRSSRRVYLVYEVRR